MRGPNFTKLGEDIRRSMPTQKSLFQSSGIYLVAFSNAGESELSYVENDAEFRIFDPL